MNITLSKEHGLAVVTVAGRLDTGSAPDFEKCVESWIAQGETMLLLDMSQLDYISSAGLRSLMLSAKSATSRGGGLCCCAIQGVVRKVFEISGFMKLLPVYDSVAEALAARNP